MRKRCKVCDKMKNVGDFHKKSGGKFGVRSECKMCRQAKKENADPKTAKRKKEWYTLNKERVLSVKKKTYEKMKKERQGYSRGYYKKHKEERLAYHKQWCAANPERVAEHRRRRRSRKSQVEEVYTGEDAMFTREIFDNRCFKCGTLEDLCIDHHYPLSEGHSLSTTNAVLLCRSCNSYKGTKLPDNFYSEGELREINKKFSEAKE